MKAKRLAAALDLIKGAVGSDLDVVELDHGQVRATDKVWFSAADIGADVGGYMILPYVKLASIAKTLGEKDEVTLAQRNTDCVVSCGDTVWKLNLRQAEIPPKPSGFGSSNGNPISGHKFLEAVKSLKHLMRKDLSRPGLLLVWTSPEGDLVVGDGARLGGRQIGVSGIELPIALAMEMGRMLNISMSEEVTITENEDYLKVTMQGYHIIANKLADHFEQEWYERVREQLTNDVVEMQLSRSELVSAIERVMVTAGVSPVKLFSKAGGLILETRDESNQRAIAKVECATVLPKPAGLDVNHLALAVSARSDELITVKVAESVVGIEDSTGWEILMRREDI